MLTYTDGEIAGMHRVLDLLEVDVSQFNRWEAMVDELFNERDRVLREATHTTPEVIEYFEILRSGCIYRMIGAMKAHVFSLNWLYNYMTNEQYNLEARSVVRHDEALNLARR